MPFHPAQAHLLQCLVQCLLRCQATASSARGAEDWDEDDSDIDDGDDRAEMMTRLKVMMESLTERMLGCELEDFQLVRNLMSTI